MSLSTKKLLIFIGIVLPGIFAHKISIAQTKTDIATTPTLSQPSQPLLYIDTHNHLKGRFGKQGQTILDYDGAAIVALNTMNAYGIKKMLIMPPPQTIHQNGSYDYNDLLKIIKKHPDRFAFLGGGGTLNPMIQQAIQDGKVDEAVKTKFKQKALEILGKGALGFGEMTAEHFSMNPNHPYVTAPPDHPLFLLLADIAAGNNVPIDLHMEALPENLQAAGRLKQNSNNPKVFKANIAAFERLLSHNPQAKIIWVHLGWDNTNNWTPELCGKLLLKHENLYFSIRIVKKEQHQNQILDSANQIKATWLQLFQKYPDHFMIGSDEFHMSPKIKATHPSSKSVAGSSEFLSQLPEDLRKKIGFENAQKIFNISN